MRQPSQAKPERRSEPRQPKAFALWLRPDGSPQPISAWMLDACSGGAAVLTGVDRVPAVGRRLELLEMPSGDPTVREQGGQLPRFARVLRHDDSDGMVRRVALRFEADGDVPRQDSAHRALVATCPQAPAARPPPPTWPAGPRKPTLHPLGEPAIRARPRPTGARYSL